MIICIVFVFDPLAVALIIAGIHGIRIKMKQKVMMPVMTETLTSSEPEKNDEGITTTGSLPQPKMEGKRDIGWLTK